MSELMPPSSSQLERIAAEVGAAATDLPVMLRDLWSPEACPAALLPWLAWAWSVDSWSDNWSERQKRNTIAQALSVQKIKGTIGAVRGALGALGFKARIQEWHRQSPPGEPYTFRLYLDVDQDSMQQRGVRRALEITERTKSLRSHLEAIIQRVSTRTELHIAAAAAVGQETALEYKGLQYSDGWYAVDLMTDAARSGAESTADAIDRLSLTLHSPTYRDLMADAARANKRRTIEAIDTLHALINSTHEELD